MTDKVQKIREEVVRLQNELIQEKKKGFGSDIDDACILELQNVLTYIDSLKEEPVSENLLKASMEFAKHFGEWHYAMPCFQAGAEWGKNHAMAEIQAQSMALAHGCPKEPASEDFEDAVNAYIGYAPEVDESSSVYGERQAFKAGAKWQKSNLWKPADGDDLPEYEREVVVFTQDFPNDAGMMRIAIAHRPDPKGFDGKSVTTGKVEHHTPKTYGKGGWNIPNIKYFLDVELTKEIEL